VLIVFSVALKVADYWPLLFLSTSVFNSVLSIS